MRQLVAQALEVAGCLSVLAGIWLIWPVGTLILGGFMLILAGFALSRPR